MSDFPVIFTVRDAIYGNGFLAWVTMTGHAVVREEEDGEWWVYGVCPGGIAASGDSPAEAYQNFRETYKNVLFDLVEDAAKYEDFYTDVKLLYNQVNEVEKERWDLALNLIRKGSLQLEDFFSKLPKQVPEERPTRFKVERLDQGAMLRPSRNKTDRLEMPKAA